MTKNKEKEGLKVEKLAPELLLKRGVQVSIPAPLFFRWFGKKELQLTLFHPTSRTLLKIADEYLKMAVVEDDVKLTDMVSHYQKNAKRVHKVVALGFLRESRKTWRVKLLAWYLRRNLTESHFLYLYQLLIIHGGVEDFLNTIRLIGKTRITKPMNLSQKKKTS